MGLYSFARALGNARELSKSNGRSNDPAHRSDEHYLTKFHQRIVDDVTKKLAGLDYRAVDRGCPQCRSNLVQIEVDQMPLQFCPHCRGWWFDRHELMHFTELCEDAVDGDIVDRESRYLCPVCRRKLREQPLQANSNLLVDVCPEGHGVYLEEGKFLRALEEAERVEGLTGHLNDEHLHAWRELQSRLERGEFDPSEITCRECGEAAVTLRVDDVEIDYCTQCQSCWFDTHELQHFTGQSRDIPGDHLTSRETSHTCPKCGRHLRLYQFMARTNVLVEGCPASHGVYLRSGQFPAVMQASERS